jgi:hypothetical protein
MTHAVIPRAGVHVHTHVCKCSLEASAVALEERVPASGPVASADGRRLGR